MIRGLLAGGWAATAIASLTSQPGATSSGRGVVLVTLGVALLVPAVSGASKLAAAAVMVLSSVRLAAAGLRQLPAAQSWATVAGWIGVVLSAVCAYAALAFELEAVHGRTILPIGRVGGSVLPGEPGVRVAL